jgi:truncated hemoglobin YjbI
MSQPDFEALTQYAKAFTGLTPEREALLMEVGPAIQPSLPAVTDEFYATLELIPKARAVIEGRVDSLKQTHLKWMEGLFTGPYDASYTAAMYHVGDVHVKVKLPVEFMAAGMTLISNALLPVVTSACGTDHERCVKVTSAVSSILGFSLMVMQESYQSSSLAKELEKFLAITGMSRTLFDNLASAYKD